MAKPTGTKQIADNRRARYDYELLERLEAGIVLTGTEVKSLREGRVALAQAYADMRGLEVWLIGAEIAEYGQGNIANHEPTRDRKLLLSRGEISTLLGKVREKGLTLVPTRLYFKDGKVKVEIAVARGKERTTSAATSPTATRSGRWSGRSSRGGRAAHDHDVPGSRRSRAARSAAGSARCGPRSRSGATRSRSPSPMRSASASAPPRSLGRASARGRR